jgi:hypothetical protein
MSKDITIKELNFNATMSSPKLGHRLGFTHHCNMSEHSHCITRLDEDGILLTCARCRKTYKINIIEAGQEEK